MKIYFAGSIRGGREHIEFYKKIIDYLGKYGEVLTEHIADDKITENGENKLTDSSIFKRDLDWLTSSDVVVAEVSNPSLGVGFEIAKAVDLKKKILCLYKIQVNKRLSAMIAGCPEVRIKEYVELGEVMAEIDDYMIALR
ncbi:MAG: nucleoside 2-deoxyribosyltransferase [Bacteroidales bacterium]|nr:nucleoside 2-deoxyribosyltransferase [Bacteroidales bacterium]